MPPSPRLSMLWIVATLASLLPAPGLRAQGADGGLATEPEFRACKQALYQACVGPVVPCKEEFNIKEKRRCIKLTCQFIEVRNPRTGEALGVGGLAGYFGGTPGSRDASAQDDFDEEDARHWMAGPHPSAPGDRLVQCSSRDEALATILAFGGGAGGSPTGATGGGPEKSGLAGGEGTGAGGATAAAADTPAMPLLIEERRFGNGCARLRIAEANLAEGIFEIEVRNTCDRSQHVQVLHNFQGNESIDVMAGIFRPPDGPALYLWPLGIPWPPGLGFTPALPVNSGFTMSPQATGSFRVFLAERPFRAIRYRVGSCDYQDNGRVQVALRDTFMEQAFVCVPPPPAPAPARR